MAKDQEHNPMSSEELLKRAWESIGRADSAEGTRQRSSSASGEMTSSANASSAASTRERSLAAEEIARLLGEEEQGRRRSGRPAEAPRLRRTPPGDMPPPRPRRTASIEVAPSQLPPPQVPPSRPRRTASIEVPPSQLPPPQAPPREVLRQETVPPAGRSTGRQKWAILLAIWALLLMFGRFADDVSTESDDVPVTLPATTEPVSLDDSLLVGEGSLEPGVCIVWLPPGENSVVATVPCTESHQYEVFAVVDSAAGSTEYAGPDEVYDLGYDACFEEFFDYVGETYVDSPWYIRVIPPTETQWVEEEDRMATCLLYQPGEEGPVYSEGTARGGGSPSA